MRFAARRAAALPECTRHRRSSTQRVLQPPPCGRRRGQRHPLPHGRGAQRAARLCGRPYQAPTRGRGTAPHDPRKARGFMCTQGASRGCRRGAAHLSLRASPRGTQGASRGCRRGAAHLSLRASPRGLTSHRALRASPRGLTSHRAPAPPHVGSLLTAPPAPPHVGSLLTAPPRLPTWAHFSPRPRASPRGLTPHRRLPTWAHPSRAGAETASPRPPEKVGDK